MDRSRQTPMEWFRVTLTNFPKLERDPSWVQWPQFPIAKERRKENTGGGRAGSPLFVWLTTGSGMAHTGGTHWLPPGGLVSADTAGLGLRNGFSRDNLGVQSSDTAWNRKQH